MPGFRYLRTWLVAVMAFIGIAAVFNGIVDPYGLFGLVSIEGFNRVKSQAGQRAEAFKRLAAARMQPKTVILGNSRAEIGFDPRSAEWPERLQPVFNLALPGTGVESALDQFDAIANDENPRLVLMGLDFLDFRVEPESSVRSHVDSPAARMMRERMSALLTMNALMDSLATVKSQHDPFAPALTESGFNPMRDYVAIAQREGYYAMFRQRNEQYARNWVNGPKSVLFPDGRRAPEFGALTGMIERGRVRGTKVLFVIYPYHAEALVLFHEAGLWMAFESWKRELVEVTKRVGRDGDIQLWDFSGFTPYADERVPRAGDRRTGMRWYWEAGHFKKELGDAMLARMLAAKSDSDGWGVRLTPENVERVLERIRAERDNYMRSHREEVDEMRRIVRAVPLADPRRLAENERK